jgi:hypothetical protein
MFLIFEDIFATKNLKTLIVKVDYMWVKDSKFHAATSISALSKSI